MEDNIFDNSVNLAPMEESMGQANETGTEGEETEYTPSSNEQGVSEGTAEVSDGWQKEFQSPEELYNAYQNTKKSYEHLRPKFTKTAQELSDLRRQAPAQTDTQVAADPQYVGQSSDPRKVLSDFVGEIVRPIKEQNEELIMHNQVSKMMVDHPDFAELSEDIMEVFKDDPSLWNTKNPIEKAYKLAKSSKLGDEVSRAVVDARNSAYADKEIKVLGSGNQAKPKASEVTKSDADKIGDSIVSSYQRGNNIFL